MTNWPPKVFLDASVLFSAAYSSSGSARDLLAAGSQARLQLIASNTVVEEARRNLGKKQPLAVPLFDLFLATGLLTLVDPPDALIAEVATKVELKDAPIVAGAISAGADFLATYDHAHLLTQAELIRDQFGVEVTMPKEVLDVIARKTP